MKTGSDFSGVGAFDVAMNRLGVVQEKNFVCDMDKFARRTYLANFGTNEDLELLDHPDVKFIDSVYYRLYNAKIKPSKEEIEKASDLAKVYAHKFSFYYPWDVYEREIPTESLDIYMTSPPCQAFSLAGKRKGKDDLRGILFFNSLEFIQKNKPKTFIFENVKGLLSSKNGLTFENSLYLCFYEFSKLKEWQKLNTQTNNLNLLSQTVSSYLFMNWQKKLGLKKTKSGTSFISNSELGFEKMESIVGSGLKRRLKFLEGRIYQIMKKSNYYQEEGIVQFGHKEEDLVLSQKKLYLIENLLPKATSMLEKTVGINLNTSLFANQLLEDNSKKGKLYTTLTELNSIIDPRIFIYVIEMNIIRLIILALDLSLNLWKGIWLILTGKQEFTGLKTFDEWLFNLDHLNYHIYWKVLNAKKHGVPQNRERVFLIGIRDDEDNKFQFPREEHLTKRLKDVLEQEVDPKYFLSEKMISGFLAHNKRHSEEKGQDGFNWKPKDENDIAACLRANAALAATDNTLKVAVVNQDTQASSVYSQDGVSQTMTAGTHGYVMGYIQVKSATAKGYEEATEGDSINFSVPNSETRRGLVGKGVSQTLDTACNQAVWIQGGLQQNQPKQYNGISPCLTSAMGMGGGQTPIHNYDYKIRRLTPRECFRLMDFPDTFTWPVSDSQAYKQAGNSIVVNVLYKILKNLSL
jgi:DNA-cytosine methyltransferase